MTKRVSTGEGRKKGALSLVGAWKDVPEEELNRLVADIYEAREKDEGRPVDLEVASKPRCVPRR